MLYRFTCIICFLIVVSQCNVACSEDPQWMEFTLKYVHYLPFYRHLVVLRSDVCEVRTGWMKLWSWYVYSLNGRALFDSWLYFLKGTECCLWSKNWGSIKLSGRSLTDGHWILDWLITLNCDHNMFILSNGRALFDPWLQFLKGTGYAEP